jgi:predicted PolB exonuclease-like 3'-5' exonuclease
MANEMPNEKLNRLSELCSRMDWLYDYTDDHSVWKKYHEMNKSIHTLKHELCEEGHKEEAIRILLSSIEKHCGIVGEETC